MRKITFWISDADYSFLVSLVRKGVYLNISDAIRSMIRQAKEKMGDEYGETNRENLGIY